MAFAGSVQGDMDVKFVLDGEEMKWNPSNGELLNAKELENLNQHSIRLTILDISPKAFLSISLAYINASTLIDML